jgi:hypothetical protein
MEARPGGYGARVHEAGSALEVDVPLDRRSLRPVRLVALDAASRAGLSVDAASELQAAIDELCVAIVDLAVAVHQPGRLVVRLRIRPGEVHARGVARVDPDRRRLVLGRLARSILEATVDSFGIVDEHGFVCFEVRKRAAEVEHAG